MSMLPTIKFLIESKLPVWIFRYKTLTEYSQEKTLQKYCRLWYQINLPIFFSGDFDSVCPLPATKHTVLDLALPVMTPWRPWTAKEEVSSSSRIRIFSYLHDSSQLADGVIVALAGGRICSGVRRWIHISYCARSWPYGSILPA
jgi:hypothetical protein